MGQREQDLVDSFRSTAVPLEDPSAYTKLVQDIKDKQFILLGGSTHGSQEFYSARVEITKQLILNHGLTAIAIEGDWPSAYRINRYVRWLGEDNNANEALSGFKRFPLWMWRNTVVLDFIVWLRNHNENLPRDQQVGFYGLDMYSMYESVAAVLDYLDEVDPKAGARARRRYECLDHMGGESQYGYGVMLGHRPSCEDEVVEQLLALRAKAATYTRPSDPASEDDHFQAEQNARLIHSAESYYRQLFDPRVSTWNVRDTHMIDTLDNLKCYLARLTQRPAKIAVWEHNSHVGDARATCMTERGQKSVGQLARERYGIRCALIGLLTYEGTVTASQRWGAPAQRKQVLPAIEQSVEDALHRVGISRFYVPLTAEVAKLFAKPRLMRSIGVVYSQQNERESHYVNCRLAEQFDGIVYIDKTRALEPLDPTSEWIRGEQVIPRYSI